jgi:hypothetical protein
MVCYRQPALLLALGFCGCSTQGLSRVWLEPLAAATASPTLLEFDGHGVLRTIRVEQPLHRVPEAARFAAGALQPRADAERVFREVSDHGRGWRFVAAYADQQVRTVLVDGDGHILHKTWSIDPTTAPAAVLAAARASCPGQITGVEIGEPPAVGAVEYSVTMTGHDQRHWLWRGNAEGKGATSVEQPARVRVPAPATGGR